MKIATEPLITLKSLIHFGCTCVPVKVVEHGKILLVRMVTCKHLKENRLLEITRKDI